MKKRVFSLWMIIIMLLQVTIVSANSFRVSVIPKLTELGVIPAYYPEINETSFVTRKEACELFVIIATSNATVPEYKNQEALESKNRWKYIDIEDQTKNCSIAVDATLLGLLKGSLTENSYERLARFDEVITWEECLIMALRALNSSYNKVDEKLKVYKEKYPDQNPVLTMAKEVGLINQDNIAYTSAVILDATAMNQAVTWEDFSQIVYTMLYIPKTVHAYGGIVNEYRINAFR